MIKKKDIERVAKLVEIIRARREPMARKGWSAREINLDELMSDVRSDAIPTREMLFGNPSSDMMKESKRRVHEVLVLCRMYPDEIAKALGFQGGEYVAPGYEKTNGRPFCKGFMGRGATRPYLKLIGPDPVSSNEETNARTMAAVFALCEDDHAMCREGFKRTVAAARACLESKGIAAKDISALRGKVAGRQYFTVEAMSRGKRLFWEDTADCAWDARARAVREWCGLDAEE